MRVKRNVMITESIFQPIKSAKKEKKINPTYLELHEKLFIRSA